jgi:hypothetical protein
MVAAADIDAKVHSDVFNTVWDFANHLTGKFTRLASPESKLEPVRKRAEQQVVSQFEMFA